MHNFIIQKLFNIYKIRFGSKIYKLIDNNMIVHKNRKCIL